MRISILFVILIGCSPSTESLFERQCKLFYDSEPTCSNEGTGLSNADCLAQAGAFMETDQCLDAMEKWVSCLEERCVAGGDPVQCNEFDTGACF